MADPTNKSSKPSHHIPSDRVVRGASPLLLEMRLEQPPKITPYELAEMIAQADEANRLAKLALKREQQRQEILQAALQAVSLIRAEITLLQRDVDNMEKMSWKMGGDDA